MICRISSDVPINEHELLMNLFVRIHKTWAAGCPISISVLMDETNSPVNKLACDITRIFYRDLARILSQEVLLSVI